MKTPPLLQMHLTFSFRSPLRQNLVSFSPLIPRGHIIMDVRNTRINICTSCNPSILTIIVKWFINYLMRLATTVHVLGSFIGKINLKWKVIHFREAHHQERKRLGTQIKAGKDDGTCFLSDAKPNVDHSTCKRWGWSIRAEQLEFSGGLSQAWTSESGKPCHAGLFLPHFVLSAQQPGGSQSSLTMP